MLFIYRLLAAAIVLFASILIVAKPTSEKTSTEAPITVSSSLSWLPSLDRDIYIEKGDEDVTMPEIRDVADVLRKDCIPVLSRNITEVLHAPVVVKLYTKQSAYEQAVQRYFPAVANAQTGVQFDAFTNGNTAYIPMYKYETSGNGQVVFHNPDLSNTLTHELTHAMLNVMGVSIPIWVNEGFAWYNGLNSEKRENPSFETVLTNQNFYNFEMAMEREKVVALSQNETAIAREAYYNLEYEDYNAVSELIADNGMGEFKHFLLLTVHCSAPDAYREVYQMKIEDYENLFYDFYSK